MKFRSVKKKKKKKKKNIKKKIKCGRFFWRSVYQLAYARLITTDIHTCTESDLRQRSAEFLITFQTKMNLAIVAVSLFLLMTSCETLPSQGNTKEIFMKYYNSDCPNKGILFPTVIHDFHICIASKVKHGQTMSSEKMVKHTLQILYPATQTVAGYYVIPSEL